MITEQVRSSRRRGGFLTRCAALCVLAGTLAAAPARADQQPDAAMLRYPAISREHVCFIYANKLWLSPRTGGVATPVASPAGQVMLPRFSPDGKAIAFSGNYDGNRDLYTVPTAGGTPSRVTHHPGNESLSQWTSDNKLLFMSSGIEGAGLARQSQLYWVSSGGGMPEKLPMPYAGFGAVSGDGKKVAFTPHSTDNRTWKRYRGGMATDIWVMDLKDQSAIKITDWEGTDTLPMWGFSGAKNTVYYVSDAGPEHRLNIWAYDLDKGQARQVTKFADDDVRWPSIGPGADDRSSGEIVFQLGSKLMVLDVGTGQSRALNITIPGAKPALRVRGVDASGYISDASISPTGKRVVIEARGDIWTAPAKEGVTRNLTASDGVFERDPSWSPDGKWIVYFSDEQGEYDLYIRPSGAKSPEEEKKDEEKKDADKKDDEKKAAEDAAAAKVKPTRLTNLGAGFRYGPRWSGDSKFITFTDKAGALMLLELKIEGDKVSGDLKTIDTDPWATSPAYSWSHDNAWIAYDRREEGNGNDAIWLYNVKSGVKTKVTDGFFSCASPAFDRKGDYLYYRSARNFAGPVYDDRGSTFAYTNTQQLLAAPLRADVKNPFEVKDEQEEVKTDKKKDAKPADKKDEKKDDKSKETAKGEVEVSTWSGKAVGGNVPPEGFEFSLVVWKQKDGSVKATATAAMGTLKLTGTFDAATKTLTLKGDFRGAGATLIGKVDGEKITGTWAHGESSGDWSASLVSKETESGEPAKKDDKSADKKDEAKKDEKKDLVIDLDGFERRAMLLPIAPGSFGQTAVTHDNKLLFVRSGARGAGEGVNIKIFDMFEETREEKTAVGGAGGFDLSADGKKLLIRRGSSLVIHDATAGGGKAQMASPGPMRVTIDPKKEWKQIITDVYRLNRDFFYEPTMHGVDWAKVRDHYLAMVDDCSNREDVNYLITEMIAELNIGHAYLRAPGEVEGAPGMNVGMLGCDYVLEKTPSGAAYKITAIHEGGTHDADARGPLSRPASKKNRVEVGDYVLAVNGVPVDTSKDIYAAFIGTADKPTLLTVSKKPVIDETAREAVVKPLYGEVDLRYRAWVEGKRAYVAEKSGGKVGYIYVPNTGVDGQDELFRQFMGQQHMEALIIDDRWNGGGQIPNRFIELLNRPVTNRWALRDGQDWTWPQDAHYGPKCMLANGLAGSGGDMFPWLFKHHKLGPVIGTRTWGGLVGISGNPQLIDGGSISVPRFGFYKLDGTWGVEGHGVDPDVAVLDDPSKMTKGQDPQLDVAIEMMVKAAKENPYVPAKRPPSPDRKGMGVPKSDW